jgi:hypothetical protein
MLAPLDHLPRCGNERDDTYFRQKTSTHLMDLLTNHSRGGAYKVATEVADTPKISRLQKIDPMQWYELRSDWASLF